MTTGEVGRNERCPCGSGKKYKRCCLAKAVVPYNQEDRASAFAKLMAFIEATVKQDQCEVLDEFWGQYSDRKEELGPNWRILSEAAFNHYFAFDMEWADGERLIDIFLALPENDGFLRFAEREFLKILRGTSMHLYELTDLVPGASVTLRDLIEGPTITVHERSGSRTMAHFEWYAARINPQGASGKPEIECVLQIPRIVREELLLELKEIRADFLNEQPGDSELFYKEIAPLFHETWVGSILEPSIPELANTDGEQMLITRVHFDVLDPSGVQAKLERDDSLGRTGDSSWHWSGKNKRGELVTLGNVDLTGDTLVLETNSRERGERGQAILQELLGTSVHHRATSHEDLARELREKIRLGNFEAGSPESEKPRHGRSLSGPPGELPPEINEALVLDHMAKYYRKWLDESIPALDDHTPREASKVDNLREKLISLIHGLEGMYEKALKCGEPAYDPSWMWDELEMGEPQAKYPPPLAHERVAEFVPGAIEVSRAVAEHRRHEPGFEELSTLVGEVGFNASLDVQRFLREYRKDLQEDDDSPDSISADPDWLKPHLLNKTNFELHRRKTFWVDGSLAYMLAQTDTDVNGRDLRVPFASFALIFTDRYVLSLAERALSVEQKSPLAGHILKVATVYVTEHLTDTGRILKLAFALDALGADPPSLISHEIVLDDEGPLDASIDRVAPPVSVDMPLAIPSPLRGLLQVTLNAILYATSAGVEPEIRHLIAGAPSPRRGQPWPKVKRNSEEVYYLLPGTIDISHVRRLQDLERTSSGRPMLKRYMVRGHWRRPSAKWKDQHMRWIQPYWKGPDIASVIERAYRLKP